MVNLNLPTQVRRIRDGLRKKGLGDVNVETVENVQGNCWAILVEISNLYTLFQYCINVRPYRFGLRFYK